MRRFLMRETVLATIAMLAISVLLTAVFSSPDEPTVTLARWATADRYDFLATAASELDGSSETARSGPPYVAGNGLVLACPAWSRPVSGHAYAVAVRHRVLGNGEDVLVPADGPEAGRLEPVHGMFVAEPPVGVPGL